MKTKKEIKAKIASLKKETAEGGFTSPVDILQWVLAPGRPKTKVTFTVNYMIGDADGETSKKATIKATNPFLKPISAALKKLYIIKGNWGLVLNDEAYEWNLKKKHISKFEYDLLCFVSNYNEMEETEEFSKFCKNNNLDEDKTVHDFMEFEGLLIADATYGFLVYQGHSIK